MMDLSRVEWRKSSHSHNGEACVEVGAWQYGNCVEVSSCTCCVIAVRDSKNPDGPKLSFSRQEFTAFTASIKRDP